MSSTTRLSGGVDGMHLAIVRPVTNKNISARKTADFFIASSSVYVIVCIGIISPDRF
jgi:hypothetical protein